MPDIKAQFSVEKTRKVGALIIFSIFLSTTKMKPGYGFLFRNNCAVASLE